MKRIVRRPWGRKKRGGWIIQPEELIKSLKDGDVAEMGGIQVGSKQLARLIDCMDFPTQELFISTNGQIEVQNIQRYTATRAGVRRTEFKKPRLVHSFRLMKGAWLPAKPKVTVIIRPRKFA